MPFLKRAEMIFLVGDDEAPLKGPFDFFWK